MSAPALPEIFGNYSLGDFVEVVSPAAIDWWPQTIGWLWLAIALLALTGYRGWKRLQHWYRNRYRGEAAVMLQQFQGGEAAVGDINRLLKLTALAAFSREQVASLSGESWGDFLNQQCESPPFDGEQLELLAMGSYNNAPLDQQAARKLLSASLAWVQQHKNPRDV